MTSTDVHAHGPHGRSEGLVTATGGLSREESAAPETLGTGELGDISGGIVDGTQPFPLPRPDGLPSPLPLPRPSPAIPLGPFHPNPRPDTV